MSGFEPAWLALREPIDHQARNAEVLRACASHFSEAETLDVVDLGCGAGANLRALAPQLASVQRWRLVDHDADLLHVAQTALCDWADSVEISDGRLMLMKAAKSIEVELHTADLAGDLAALLPARVDLVTASALFDLVSVDWMARLADLLRRRALPLYAVLTYNGFEKWSPPHPLDADMLAAFHAHQGRDKGFGPAAGPGAADALARIFAERGYKLFEGTSDWELPEGRNALVVALADGIASACRETGRLDNSAIDDWLVSRRNAAARVGHTDLFAWPV